jgi:hypothetical protein
VGLEFAFAPERILVRNVNLADVEGLAEKMPIKVRAAHILKHGPRTAVEIAAEIDAKADSVYKALDRDKGCFVKVLAADGIHRFALVERQTA